MSVFFTNPNQFLASIMVSESFNASIKMDRRYLEENTQFEASQMREILSKLTLQQRVKCVKKLPKEGNVIRENLTFKTNYSEVLTLTNLYLVDEIIVVFLNEHDPSRAKPIATIDSPVIEEKNLPLESIKKNFYVSTATPICTLGIISAAFTAGGFLVNLLSSRDNPMPKIRAVAQFALSGIAILGWWRLFQWILCINKVFMIRHTGDWVAQLRVYAYSYPSVVKEGSTQRFLLQNEVKYLQGCTSSIFQRLKNNLSL